MFLFYICVKISLYIITVSCGGPSYRFILCICMGPNDASVPTRPNTRLGTGLENCYSATHRLQGMDMVTFAALGFRM